MSPTTLHENPVISRARAAFSGGRDYLAACTVGLPSLATRTAVIADLDSSGAGAPDLAHYCDVVERSRKHFAALVGTSADRIAIGAQTSVLASLLAASLPNGAEVLLPEGDFSSIVLPFVHAGRGIRVRAVPLTELADAIGPQTALVAFSLVQSATGDVADSDAIVAAARAHGARTLCDATQAVGWMPVAADRYDAVVCHAYKWLCAPRGVAFLALSPEYAAELSPVHAGWYAGADPWSSCYGGVVDLASDASRFDTSPAWQAFVGAEPALALFASLDQAAVYAHTTGLAADFRAAMGLPMPERPSAIVTWQDTEGAALRRLAASGITASGRAGRARVAFHVFNDAHDVERAVTALTALS